MNTQDSLRRKLPPLSLCVKKETPPETAKPEGAKDAQRLSARVRNLRLALPGGNVKAFVDVAVDVGGTFLVEIRGAKLIQQEGQRAFVGAPSSKFTKKDGSTGWQAHIAFSRELAQTLIECVEATLTQHPQGFTSPEVER